MKPSPGTWSLEEAIQAIYIQSLPYAPPQVSFDLCMSRMVVVLYELTCFLCNAAVLACLFGMFVRFILVPRLISLISMEDILQVVATVAALLGTLRAYKVCILEVSVSPGRKSGILL